MNSFQFPDDEIYENKGPCFKQKCNNRVQVGTLLNQH